MYVSRKIKEHLHFMLVMVLKLGTPKTFTVTVLKFALIHAEHGLNDLRKVICLRKTSVSVERISVYKAIKIWWSMADTVCHAPPNFQ